MEVKYKDYKWGKEREVTASISEFLYDHILYREGYNKDEKVHLEEQPEVVCKMVGRLISILLDKNILNLEDLKVIVRPSWGVDNTLELKTDE